MSEESTKKLANRVSFEQRVFARFDSIDARLEKLESRSYDTKPIWEKALAVIVETGLEVGELKTKVEAIETKVGVIETKVGVIETKVGVIETKVGVIETKVDVIESKVDVIESKVDVIESKVDVIESKVDVIESRVGSLERDVAALKNDYSNLHNELVESQRDFKVKLTRRIDLVLEVMIDNRDGWRAADERLNRLESKLA